MKLLGKSQIQIKAYKITREIWGIGIKTMEERQYSEIVFELI